MDERTNFSLGSHSAKPLWVDGYLPIDTPDQHRQSSSRSSRAWLRGCLYRQRWLAGLTIGTALLIGLAITLLTTPVYESSASVRIQPWGNSIIEGQDVSAPITSSNEISNFMETLGSVIQSRRLAEIVERDLTPQARTILIGSSFDADRPSTTNNERWARLRQDAAIAALQENVSASVPFSSQIITITYRSSRPALAAQVVNRYAAGLYQLDTSQKLENNAYAREYLLGQIAEVRERLDQAELSANDYARASGIVTGQTLETASDFAPPTIIRASLSQISQSAADARSQRIEAEQRWNAVAEIPAEQLPEVLDNSVVQRLTQQKAELRSVLSQLQQRYDSHFPEVIEAEAQIYVLDRQIAQTSSNIKAGIYSEYLIARNQEAALAEELNAITSAALTEQDNSVELNGLEREAQALRAQLTTLLERYNQISTAANIESGAITLLDQASIPESPVSPDLAKNIILALVVGIALATGMGLLREIFTDQFRRIEDVSAQLGVPSLGHIPAIETIAVQEQRTQLTSPLMEAYASVRSAVDYHTSREGSVLQITSSRDCEGKSTTALALAELFARIGQKTLLIDADLRKPSIAKQLDLPVVENGLTQILHGDASVEETALAIQHEDLRVIPVADGAYDPVSMISVKRFREMIEEQRGEYSVIIIDSPPVMGLADAPDIAQIVDATIFVIEANRTSVTQAQSALRRLEQVGANVIGGVLTKYDALVAGSDHQDVHQYQYGQPQSGSAPNELR